MNPRIGEWVAVICGLGLLAVMFASWYENANGGTLDAWEAFSFVDLIIFATGLTAVIVGAVSLAGISVSLPVAGSAVTSLLAVLAISVIAIRLFDPPQSLERDMGAWLGLIWSIGIFAGAYLGMEEEPV
jgi:hypothetical protein